MDAVRQMVLTRGDKGDVVLETYSGLFTLNAPLNAKKLEIVDRIILIRSYDVIAKTILTGLTSMKDVNLLIMGGEGIVWVSQLKEYLKAPLTADHVEYAKIDFCLTDLITGTAANIYAKHVIIQGVIENHVSDMITRDYPITLVMRDNYSTAITNYHTAVPGWGNGEVIRIAANGQIAIQCQILTNENFISIKNLVMPYGTANPLFISQIGIAYSAPSTTERKKCIGIGITESTSGIAVVGYTFSLIASDGTVYAVTGNDKGNAVVKSLKTDVYSGLIVRPDYVEKRILPFGYTAGKFLKIETVMVLTPMTEKVEIKDGEEKDGSLKIDAAPKIAVDKDTVITEVDMTPAKGKKRSKPDKF
jgi:hypothetical protein